MGLGDIASTIGHHIENKFETKLASKTGIKVGSPSSGVDSTGKTARSRTRTADAKSEYGSSGAGNL